MSYFYRLILLYILVNIYIFNHSIAYAKLALSDKNLDFKANNVDYNFKENFLVATGNVEFKSENRILKADIVYYNTKENVLFAEGNVYYKDKDGNILYPKNIEIDSELQNGKLNIVNSELKDKSILFAKIIQKSSENEYNIGNMCYTSCHLINTLTPLWQVKSTSGFYDTKKDKITMYNAWVEIKDVPILWTPYASFSNFKKIREAGFLYPRISIDKKLGSELEIPFYIPLGDYQDITIDNHIYTSTNINRYLPVIKYNGNTYDGSFAINTSFYPTAWHSISSDSLQNDDWHFFLKAQNEWNDIWRSNIEIEQTSNIKYLNSHNINPQDVSEKYLSNQIINEFFINQNNYVAFNLFTPIDIYERDLKSSNVATNENLFNNEIELKYIHLQNYNNLGSLNINTNYNTFFNSNNTFFNSNNNQPNNNENITRLALMLDYNYLYITKYGNYSTQITYDNTFYMASEEFKNNLASNGNTLDNYFSYYTMGLMYEYPITYVINNSAFTIAPITSISIHNILDNNQNNMLLSDNSANITPNNIFESSTYNNFDYVDNVNSVSYGIKMYGNINSSYASFFAGQKINDTTKKSYTIINNIQVEDFNSPSNYFISFIISPIKNINVKYESILLPNLQNQKNITDINIISSIASFNTHYTSTLTNKDTSTYATEISFDANVYLSQKLSFGLSNIYTIDDNKTFTLKSVDSNLTWFNDCLYLQAYISRSYYLNDAQNSYGIKIIIKGVGANDLKIL